MPLHLAPTFREALANTDRTLIGVWACAGSPLVTEIMAGSGADWLLIDMEHSANSLESVLTQLQVVVGYPITPVVRVPFGDDVILKQVLDIGAQNILVPMVSTAEQARSVVSAVRYAPRGTRGVGAALSRSARWNRVDNYLQHADQHVSLFVQIENGEGVENAAAIAAVDGVDGVFVGPSDLAASLGIIGQQSHPTVLAAIASTFAAVHGAGKPVGINAFGQADAERFRSDGANFIAVGADVSLLARASEELVARFRSEPSGEQLASY